MSGADPKSASDLRALAQKSRTGHLSKNDQWELDRAIKQSGRLSNELKTIRDRK